MEGRHKEGEEGRSQRYRGIGRQQRKILVAIWKVHRATGNLEKNSGCL